MMMMMMMMTMMMMSINQKYVRLSGQIGQIDLLWGRGSTIAVAITIVMMTIIIMEWISVGVLQWFRGDMMVNEIYKGDGWY